MQDTAIIVCNGEINDYVWVKKNIDLSGFIISVDGGARHCIKMNITPDLLLGDFDSVTSDHLEYFIKQNIGTIKFSKEKDFSDTELAINVAVEKGFKNLIIIAGTGSRLDHSLSNIFILKKLLENGIKASIINENNELFLINDTTDIINDNVSKISMLALTDKVEGINTEGLLYVLKNATLELGASRGISNEFISDKAKISINSGILIVCKSRD